MPRRRREVTPEANAAADGLGKRPRRAAFLAAQSRIFHAPPSAVPPVVAVAPAGREPMYDAALEVPVAAVAAGETEEAKAERLVAEFKARLIEEKAVCEAEIRQLLQERSGKEGEELVEVDFKVWATIQSLQLINNRFAALDVRTGMLPLHQFALGNIVVANGMVSMYRPINPEAEKWMKGGAQGKTLFTKGKSSGFDCIAGLIPVDVRLSKLLRNPGNYNPDEIRFYQHKMDSILTAYDPDVEVTLDGIAEAYGAAAQKISAAREAAIALKAKVGQQLVVDELEDFQLRAALVHDLPPQIKVTKTHKLASGEEVQVYYVVNPAVQQQDEALSPDARRADVVFGANNQPIFIIEVAEQYKAYNPVTKQYDLDYVLPADHERIPLQVLAYQPYEIDEDGVVQKKTPRLVTADYDEQTSVALRVHPFMQNTVMQTLSSELRRLAEAEDIAAVRDRYVVDTVLRYEQRRNAEARNIETFGTIGRANAEQRALLTVLRDMTEWAVNHGPEANSPAPQKFPERDSYPCFYPDGRIVIVEGGEADVCQFINEQRRLGFPLAVNPRWGWIKEEDGTMRVPEGKRFDWAEVDAYIGQRQPRIDEILREYEGRLELLSEFDFDDLCARAELGDLKETDQARLIVAQQNLAVEIVDLMLQIEILRLEPEFTYPGLLASYKYRVLTREDRAEYARKIKSLITQFHGTAAAAELAEIGEGIDLETILATYDKIEAKLRELEGGVPICRYDGSVRQNLIERREKELNNLIKNLHNKITKIVKIAEEDVFLRIIRQKREELFNILETGFTGISRGINYGQYGR